MILAFIGPDMTGKSNIANCLSKDLGIPVFKNTGEWKADLSSDDYYLNLLKFGGTFLMDFLLQVRPAAILDRFYPCEYAYSAIFGRKTNENLILKLDEKFASIDGKLIFCYKKSYTGVQDDLFPDDINDKTLKKIEERYRMFLSKTKCDVLFLETSDMNLKNQISEIKRFLGVE